MIGWHAQAKIKKGINEMSRLGKIYYFQAKYKKEKKERKYIFKYVIILIVIIMHYIDI